MKWPMVTEHAKTTAFLILMSCWFILAVVVWVMEDVPEPIEPDIVRTVLEVEE